MEAAGSMMFENTGVLLPAGALMIVQYPDPVIGVLAASVITEPGRVLQLDISVPANEVLGSAAILTATVSAI